VTPEPMTVANRRRRLSAGVELQENGSADVRVWAPACRRIDVIIERQSGAAAIVPLLREADGFFGGLLENAEAGDRYWYQLDSDRRRPDPVSRFQPEGPHGPSAIVDPSRFPWTDAGWPGVPAQGQVIYELHVGTFTHPGTWSAAAERLDDLARLGITIVEMMPVADFAGRWGWGYDGVNLYAPTRLYGSPDDLRRFVDRAHALGLAVILDVVYNHLGPEGNYLSEFSVDYFTTRYKNDWGQALNFEGPRPAREFFVENAAYWIDEFHFDGLRLDATQDVHDGSPEHVLAEIARRARRAAGDRNIYIVAENEPQQTKLVRDQSRGGYGLNALFNDDYHHTAFVALTERREAYYSDYRGSPQEFISCVKYGHLYQGQWYSWQKRLRGTPGLDLPGTAFVHFLENHDQVANTSLGKRVHQVSSPGRYRALTALTLLGPATPLLFQGQEFASSIPFLFFADHQGELRDAIRKGRREFLAQFPSAGDLERSGAMPLPDDPETFRKCKLDWSEREAHDAALALHRDLLDIRRNDPVIAASAGRRVDGAVLAPQAFAIRYDGDGPDDRLLIVNLGSDLDLASLPEPLLAPPAERQWVEQWSSEAAMYGGAGRTPLRFHPAWHLRGESAVLLRPAASVPGRHEPAPET
jgi:maltooligosyltrehalose trehalohydrolase